MRFIWALAIVSLASTAGAQSRKPVKPTPRAVAPKAARAPQPVPPRAIPESGDLSAEDIVTIGRMAASAAADKFSDDPSLRFVGRTFVVTLPASATSADYNKETRALTVSTSAYQDGFDLKTETTTREYQGQNSYGAKATITELRGNIYGLTNPGESYSRKAIKFETVADGSAARDLSNAIRLRVTGQIVKASGIYARDGSIFFSRPLLTDATISDPLDTFVQRYYVAAVFTKADWIDSRTGEVLKSVILAGGGNAGPAVSATGQSDGRSVKEDAVLGRIVAGMANAGPDQPK